MGARCLSVLLIFATWLQHAPGADDGLSALGKPPDWQRLEAYDGTITRETFLDDLTQVYSLGEAYKLTFDVQEDHVRIKTGSDSWMTLRFRQPETPQPPIPRYWRPREAIIQKSKNPREPLAGLRIALDPGHLGGRWARIEERWYTKEEGAQPVTEGDMTLIVAKLLVPRLEALGAEVDLIRSSTTPVTRLRPKHFLEQAEADLTQMGILDPNLTYRTKTPPEKRWRTVQWHSEKYFYRLSEIRQRAALVNQRLKPDLVLCLHFNAETWGDPVRPTFVPRNHLHLLINGAYSIPELGRHDERFEMLLRLLQGMHAEELALAEVMATRMARETQLPAYEYITNNVKRPSAHPYVYARNLLANRLFQCPVIYLEPYVMNCEEVYARIQAGLYEDKRSVHGHERPSLYHEYAEGVIQGLLNYYAPAQKHSALQP